MAFSTTPLPYPEAWQTALAQRYPSQLVGFALNARLNTLSLLDAVYPQSAAATPVTAAIGHAGITESVVVNTYHATLV